MKINNSDYDDELKISLISGEEKAEIMDKFDYGDENKVMAGPGDGDDD